jgi:tetratricopeptide (TPR) repeat protein
MAAAAATYLDLPPVSAVALVRNGSEDALSGAEALVAANRHGEAQEALEALWEDIRHDPELALRQRLALGWSSLYLGELEEAERLFAHADGIAQSPRFCAADRAEVLYRRGCVALKQSHVADATALFTQALDANERAPQPRPALASRAHEWRSRCHVFLRDWVSALRDVEQALELAAEAGDLEAEAHALFQASIIAERQRQWLLARCHAEQALDLYRRLDNRLCTARMLNNLGGIDFLLGNVDAAEESLLAAIETAAELGSDADFAQGVNSLAQVYLRTGRPLEARARALRAVDLLQHRTDFLDELGNAQLVIARSFELEGDPDRAAAWLDRAEQTLAGLGSTSHLASAWMARGDLARSSGDVEAAADHYRRAADLLQDVHF